MRFPHWAGFVTLSLLPAFGCDNSPADRVNSNATSSEGAEQPGATISETTAPRVDVDIQSWEQIQQWVAQQQGKVVVIDVWSTWCVPCVKEFPHFVALHQAFSRDVACASINVDYYGSEDEKPEDLKPRVVKFLTSKQATMQNFISSDPDEVVLQQIDTAAVPATIVYDREGQLHTVFNNDQDAYGAEGFNYTKDITPLVQQLLKSEE